MEGSNTNTSVRTWPYTAAASTEPSSKADALLCAILASEKLDEISTAEGAVERYVRRQGMVGKNGRLQTGIMFWVYPTGGKGPYEELEDGSLLKHGCLLTVERGVLVEDVVTKAQVALPQTGIVHEHVASGQ